MLFSVSNAANQLRDRVALVPPGAVIYVQVKRHPFILRYLVGYHDEVLAAVTRLHLYFGLLCFSQFLVYGAAGLTAALQANRERPKIAVSQRYVPFRSAAGASDQQVADAVYRLLDLPFTRPMPGWFLKRTPEGRLRLDFYNINGIYRVTVEESEGRVRIEDIRNSIWLFLEDMHAMTGEDGEHFRLLRIWGWYNRVGMWSLLGMTLSGVWLRWAAQPRRLRVVRVAHRTFGLASALILLVFGVSAVQMTSGPWARPKATMSEIQATLPLGLEEGQALLTELSVRGLARGELDYVRLSSAGIAMRVTQPTAHYDIDYTRATGVTVIKTGRLGLFGVLNRLHRTAGLWHADWTNRIWNGVLILTSLSLISLALTGIRLWLERRRERMGGSISLALSTFIGAGLLLSIRFP